MGRLVLVLAFLAMLLAFSSAQDATDTLSSYVYASDDATNWTLVDDTTNATVGVQVFTFFLTSQRWGNDTENPVWTHWVQACIPFGAPTNQPLYLVPEGGNTPNVSDVPQLIGSETLSELLCLQGRIPTAQITAVPNAPITFTSEPNEQLDPDPFMAKSYQRLMCALGTQPLTQEVAEYDALLPMTKSAVVAMDLLSSELSSSFDGFALTGASKRGWTSLLVAALNDSRVVSVVPVVAPFFSMQSQFIDQYKSYGDWSFPIQAYADYLEPWFQSEDSFFEKAAQSLPEYYLDTINPYPKYFALASRDEFFQPDVGGYFWDELEQPKWLFIAPNANHALLQLGPEDPLQAIGESMILMNSPFEKPIYEYNISQDGLTITLEILQAVTTGGPLTSVEYIATPYFSEDKDTRDWRGLTCFDLSCLQPNRQFIPRAPINLPADPVGFTVNVTANAPAPNTYTAFYVVVEARYNISGAQTSFWFSSDLSILPRNQFPYEECGVNCTCGYECSVCPIPPAVDGEAPGDGDDDDGERLLGLLALLGIIPCIVFLVVFAILVFVGVAATIALFVLIIRKKQQRILADGEL